MRMGQKGLTLLKKFEGWRSEAYLDPVGIWTIGYGHTSAAGSPKVVSGMTISRAEGENILRKDLKLYEKAVNDKVKVTLNQNQFDALTSFCYNVGPGNFGESSVLKAVNSQQFHLVPFNLMRWTKAGGKTLEGLKRRRKAEGRLFNTPVPVRVGEAAKELSHSRVIAGQTSVATGTAGVVISENTPNVAETVSQTGNDLSMIAYISEWIGIISAILIVGGIILTVYARWDDARNNPKTSV